MARRQVPTEVQVQQIRSQRGRLRTRNFGSGKTGRPNPKVECGPCGYRGMRQRHLFDDDNNETGRVGFECPECGFRPRPMSLTEWGNRLDAFYAAGASRIVLDD